MEVKLRYISVEMSSVPVLILKTCKTKVNVNKKIRALMPFIIFINGIPVVSTIRITKPNKATSYKMKGIIKVKTKLRTSAMIFYPWV